MTDSASPSTGKTVARHIYVHADALDTLAPEFREAIHDAAGIAGVRLGEACNVVKIDRDRAAISLLDYPDFFEAAFPVLRRAWSVDPATRTVRFRSYEHSLNPPILHRKELLLPEGHPQREIFAALTAAAESLGLFEDPRRIGFRQAWDALLIQRGYRIAGHALVPIGNDESDTPAPDDFAGVARHLTALSRYGFSAPVQSLARFGFLDGSKTVFDYGCGRGDDLRGLRENGIEAAGWDPYYAPGESRCNAISSTWASSST
jgi:hypothetical protein